MAVLSSSVFVVCLCFLVFLFWVFATLKKILAKVKYFLILSFQCTAYTDKNF